MTFAFGPRRLTAPARERGMALIMVLVILTVVTVLGVTAMRAGLLHVAMGTNAQVNMLTFQTADAGFSAVENTITAQAATNPAAPTAPGGILNMAAGFERVVCLKKSGLSVPNTPTGRVYCDPTATNDTDYLSPRNAAMVQVAVLNPTDTSSTPTIGGTGTDDQALPGGGSMLIRVIATSVLPNYGSASKTEIKDCLQTKPSDDTTDATVETVTDCLTTKGASFTTLVQEYSYSISP